MLAAVDRGRRPHGRFATILGASTKRPPANPLEPEGADANQSLVNPLELRVRGFRAEPPRDVSCPDRVKQSMQISSYQRVLLGSGGWHEHARVQIGGGHLAGCEIHLALVGCHIDAQLLTRNEGSRQTLVAAMDAVRERLRARGLELRPATGGSGFDAREQKPDGQRPGFDPAAGEKT